MFFTLFGYWAGGGGSPKGLVHNLLVQLFTLGSFKIEVFETYFFESECCLENLESRIVTLIGAGILDDDDVGSLNHFAEV